MKVVKHVGRLAGRALLSYPALTVVLSIDRCSYTQPPRDNNYILFEICAYCFLNGKCSSNGLLYWWWKPVLCRHCRRCLISVIPLFCEHSSTATYLNSFVIKLSQILWLFPDYSCISSRVCKSLHIHSWVSSESSENLCRKPVDPVVMVLDC